MSAHTPGPWAISPPMERCSLGDGLYVQREADGTPTAFASSGNLADARLLAAAPELLAACKAAIEEFREFMPTTAGDTLTMCEAAVAKAEEVADK